LGSLQVAASGKKKSCRSAGQEEDEVRDFNPQDLSDGPQGPMPSRLLLSGSGAEAKVFSILVLVLVNDTGK